MATQADDGWETASDNDDEVLDQSEDEAASEINPKSKTETRSTTKSKPKAKADPIGQDVEGINQILQDNPNLKFGFVVYRCCAYSKPEKWDRFMKKLRRRTRLNLRGDNAEHLYDRIDWCVQEDPALETCDEEKLEADVRRRFKKWIKECGEERYWLPSSRFLACVMVEDDDLTSVLRGRPAEIFDESGHQYVTLVSLDKNEGSMSVGFSYLVPRVYVLLQDCGWDNFAPYSDTEVACP